ncbi:MAG TPA: hypothetical protein VFC65_17955 [Prolixibacteraceae bacterium]|nr:hypothetical protein [Prolixibacteraceae bacterium]
MDPTNLSFNAKLDTLNSWEVTVLGNGAVTIQRASDDLFLTNEVNEHDGGYKFVSDEDGTGNVNFTLLKAVTTSAKTETNDVKSYVYQLDSKLVFANASNLKTICVYNLTGQHKNISFEFKGASRKTTKKND